MSLLTAAAAAQLTNADVARPAGPCQAPRCVSTAASRHGVPVRLASATKIGRLRTRTAHGSELAHPRALAWHRMQIDQPAYIHVNCLPYVVTAGRRRCRGCARPGVRLGLRTLACKAVLYG